MLNDDWLPLWKAHKMGRHLRRHFDRHGFHLAGGPRGFWAAAGMTVRRGDMKFRILDLLTEGPRHGYQIIRDLEERNEGYRASPGSVYPTLQMLEGVGHSPHHGAPESVIEAVLQVDRRARSSGSRPVVEVAAAGE